MTFRAVWPTLDPDDETVGSFDAAVAMIPRAVRRRFGLGPVDPFDDEADRERARLRAYTAWGPGRGDAPEDGDVDGEER